MRLLLSFSIWSLSIARPDFESVIPFFELNENSRPMGSYRHRAKGGEEGKANTRINLDRSTPIPGSISEPLARSEGWTGGKNMKKIMIVKDKKEPEKAQGIHIHSLPKGAKAFALPSQSTVVDEDTESITDLRRKFNVSLKTGESILPPFGENTQATEWPPIRSTLAPNGGEFNKQTFRLLSGWLNSEKERRDQKREDEEWKERKRLPMIRALARARPIVRIDDIAEPPLPISVSPMVSITTPAPFSTTHRIVKNQRKKMKKPFQKKFKEFSSMSFTPLEEKPPSVTTVIPPSFDIETTHFVENLAASIEKEESEVLSKRREHRKRNYGVNPLMYKVVDGVLYDRAGQPIRRVDVPFRDEPRRPKSFLGPAKTVVDHEIGHDDFSIHSTTRVFHDLPSTPPSFDLDSSPLPLDPLPLPTAAMISFPQSTTPFHWGQPLSTTPIPRLREGKAPPPFPFINCYMNSDGFMCCNRALEGVLRSAYDSLPCRKNGCSVQHVVKRVRSEVEKKFGSSFEVLASLGDFAMHAHFTGDLTCKIEREGRFIAAFATVKSSDSSNPVTDYLMLPRNPSSGQKELQTKKNKRKKVVSNQTLPPPIPIPATRFNGGTIEPPTPEESLEFLQTSAASTTIPNISISFDDQLDAPSIDVNKPDDNFHRVVPFHERSRGKNDFSFN